MKSMRCSVTSRQVVAYMQICIFTVCHLQKKHMTANKPLYMTSIDLEEAFDQVPRALCHLKGSAQAKNRTMAGALGPIHLQGCEKQGKSSEEFDSGVDVYQGSTRVRIWG